jgi:hypothetical protein
MHLGPNEDYVGLNPAGPTKKCSICKIEKPLAQFYQNRRGKDGLQTQCKECHKNWYRKNVVKHKANVRRHNIIRSAIGCKIVADYLATHPCVDCGESDPIVLEFDHVRGKKLREISKLKYGWASEDRLKAEIAKLRCSMC